MPKCCIDGYEADVEQEQLKRNLVYLDQYEIVCGEPIRNITPRLQSVLNSMRSPLLCGGAITRPVIAQFIWALHRDYSPRAWWKRRRLRKRLERIPIEDCMRDINAFMELTFMDAPTGGKEEKPIASSIAWMVYRFRHKPWCMAEGETANTPLRKLYQELRCWERENQSVPANRSDMKKTEFLNDLNAWLTEDPVKNGMFLHDWNADCRALASKEITQSQFDARRERAKRWVAEMSSN